MKQKNNRKGFTIVELVIVIAVIGILASVLVPTFGDVISSAKESAAKQGAKNAYTEYLVQNNGAAPEVMVYLHANGKVVALENGVPVHVYETAAAFFAAYEEIEEFTMTAGVIYTTAGEAGSGEGNTPDEPKASWDTDGDGTLSILAIGNSFSVDALEYAYQIAQDMGIEDIVIGNLYKGGCDLATHTQYAKNETPYTGNDCYYNVNDGGTWVKTASTSKSALQSRSWDFVMLQQVSGQSGQVNTYNENLDYMITYAKEHAPSAKLVWHMTWAYQQDSTHSAFTNYGKNQTTMYNAIVSAVQNKIVTNSNFDLIVPSGTAVQNSRTSVLGDTTTRDGYHMSYNYGRYLTGLMVVKTLTGLSVDEATYRPTGVDELEQKIAIDAVNKAAAQPFAVTKSAYAEDTFDFSDYELLDIDWYLHGFWNSSDGDGKHSVLINADNNKDTNHPNFYTTPYRLSKAELPVGSIIVVESGWRYRPDGWVTDNAVNNNRPGNIQNKFVIVTEEWWGDYTLRAFNVSKTAGDRVTQAEMDAGNLKVYVPKS